MTRTNASTTHQKIETGREDDGNQDEAGVAAVVNWTVPSFFFLDDWRFLFVENVPLDTLMTMQLLCTDWRRVVDTFIARKVESGVMKVVTGNDVGWDEAEGLEAFEVMQVVFLLNITKVGDNACWSAIRLAIVEIPEGIESIGTAALMYCTSLTTVSFPTTLRSISVGAFESCVSLENVDLLHTQLHEIGGGAFCDCTELKSMTIPDSLQTLGYEVFSHCFKLVPSHIDVADYDLGNEEEVEKVDVTWEVVEHLRSLQS
ncbi:hypothetical protein TrST_g3579 [Triparma strigata]|uniref:Uncharacterized protein n=1 Tax=Triparma strigata TaxID=1606541 RepID=A0A9W7B7T4_9STRA|nr:hypothetical protein TrST_g3579 [Triparma strigata]